MHDVAKTTIRPTPRAKAIVGYSVAACTHAVECWAEIMEDVMPELQKEEWCLLADLLWARKPDASWKPEMLATLLEHAHEFERIGDTWLGEWSYLCNSPNEAVKAICEQINGWDYVELHSVLSVTSFAKRYIAKDELDRHEWWTRTYRIEHARKLREIQEAIAAKRG